MSACSQRNLVDQRNLVLEQTKFDFTINIFLRSSKKHFVLPLSDRQTDRHTEVVLFGDKEDRDETELSKD